MGGKPSVIYDDPRGEQHLIRGRRFATRCGAKERMRMAYCMHVSFSHAKSVVHVASAYMILGCPSLAHTSGVPDLGLTRRLSVFVASFSGCCEVCLHSCSGYRILLHATHAMQKIRKVL